MKKKIKLNIIQKSTFQIKKSEDEINKFDSTEEKSMNLKTQQNIQIKKWRKKIETHTPPLVSCETTSRPNNIHASCERSKKYVMI